MPILYDMPLYRPPSEGNNLIVQATVGCSFNHCTFCSMYVTKAYRARPLSEIFADIDAGARDWPMTHRVFLADGDAMTLPTGHLIEILDYLAARLPNLARVSAYATPKNLNEKSIEEMAALREKKLNLVYLGIESGATAVLKRIRKGASQDSVVKALGRARAAGLKVSATVILGLGGRAGWEEHIAGTAELVNREPPTYLSTLQLDLEPAVYARFMDAQAPGFEFQDDEGILAEQESLLNLLDPPRPVIFRSNHASNCLPLAGNLPRDKDALLATVAAARAGAQPLRPRWIRGM
ncbi:MAG: radical SAM protein [Alphaproteobacteria bacterium]|nr:radical SAM protein [Alphaproteobacteria bacterium]